MTAPMGPNAPIRSVGVTRYAASGFASEEDRVAVEAPLEIRLSGETFSITMRTPGDDEELTAGFLLAEGLIGGPADLGGLRVVTDADGAVTAVDAVPPPGGAFRVDPTGGSARRGTLTTAACGVCGRTSIDDLLARIHPVDADVRFTATMLDGLTASLRDAQHVFAETGGLHAAGVADASGNLRVAREDVGRHNAVDKAVGRLLLDHALPARDHVLVVSGRSSFEIVQKAAMAGIGTVVSVSAPSSLAISVAAHAGITLVGFARGAGFVVYSGAERLTSP